VRLFGFANMTTRGADKPIWNTLATVGLIAIALPFAVYAAEKGFRFTDPDERATSRFFDVEALAASAMLYLHMATGALITVFAPLQMSRVIRDRWPYIHRVSGYLIVTAAGTTALAGLYYIARLGTIGGAVMDAGFALYGGLMLLSAWQTVGYARKRHPLHFLWAGRLIILSLASWLYRVHYGVWELAAGGLGSRPDFTGPFDQVQVFAFYLPYLAVHHYWWHRKHVGI
jgi:hypothetical protein